MLDEVLAARNSIGWSSSCASVLSAFLCGALERAADAQALLVGFGCGEGGNEAALASATLLPLVQARPRPDCPVTVME